MQVRQMHIRTWKEPRWRYQLWEFVAEPYSQDHQEVTLQISEQGEADHQQCWPGYRVLGQDYGWK